MAIQDVSTTGNGTHGAGSRPESPDPNPSPDDKKTSPRLEPLPQEHSRLLDSMNWAGLLRGASGLVIWLLIVAAIAYPLFPRHVTEVLLDVSSDLKASGRVIHEGQSVTAGLVHLAVEEPRSQRRVASAIVELKDGTFSVPLVLPARSTRTESPLPLRVTAKYFGRVPGDNGPQGLSAEGVVYVNSGPPLGPSAWWAAAVAAAAIFVLILVFTSRAGVPRVRLLFMVMYLMTFLSLVLPILITVLVARNPYLVEMMKEAPIGLVNAKAPGVREAQWLINIGGTVVSGDAAKASAPEASAAPVATASVASATSPQGTTAPPADAGPRVSGGIAVPFYLVLLAMFGAAVNLTRRVPVIQTKAEGLDLGRDMGLLEASHCLVFGRRESRPQDEHCATWAEIREQLVQNYMYVLSAPVLAIAVYYILQIVATEVTQPVLVLGSFAAGLASESIVKYVMAFADNKIKYVQATA
jgi:hypothetical protein